MNGFTGLCKLSLRTSASDGAGGVTEGTPTSLYPSLACRASPITDVNRETRFGVSGGELWRFSTPPVLGLVKRVSGSEVVPLYVIEYSGEMYDVIEWIIHGNAIQSPDHIEFKTEKR